MAFSFSVCEEVVNVINQKFTILTVGALCELDRGNPICYCPKGLTGNPFKNCSKLIKCKKWNWVAVLKQIFSTPTSS